MAHGVSVQEQSVGARPAVQVESSLPVYVGTALVHETSKRDNVNVPIYCQKLADFVDALGPLTQDRGTLIEAAENHFSVYETGPVVFVNVLDPDNVAHVATETEEEHAVAAADDPIALDYPMALSVTLLERSTDGVHQVESLAYVGTGNGTLGLVLVAIDDDTDIGSYTLTCDSAATPAAYSVESLAYVGTGDGDPIIVLEAADPTDAGSYTLTCTKAVSGPDPSEWQLAKAGSPIGAVILADGTTQHCGSFAISITEGSTLFLVADAWSFDITYAAAVPAAFTLVTPQTPGGASVDADGAAHTVDGVTVTITEGATPFDPADAWGWDVATSAVAWTTVDAADYALVYDDDTDDAQIQPVDGGAIVDGDIVRVTYTRLDETAVDSDDIVGGYAAGAYTGCEVIHQVYPRLKVVPTLLLAPQWSHIPAVASKLRTVGRSVSGELRALAILDLTTDKDDIATYSLAPAWKTSNGYTDYDCAVCWPAVKDLDGNPGRMSVHLACLCGTTDHDYDDLPYASPSNKAMQVSGVILTDAGAEYAELYLEKSQANVLNAQGIVTARQSPALGWISWGNRAGIYPSATDPRDSFIAVRRMMNHLHNVTVLTAERDVDAPGNRRLIDGVVQTMQAYLNSLVAAGALVGSPVIQFLEDDNPTTDMADGKFVFTYDQIAPPSPAEEITFKVNYDSSALAALFD